MKSEFPNIKIKLIGVQLPSQNSEMGMNYGATKSEKVGTNGGI